MLTQYKESGRYKTASSFGKWRGRLWVNASAGACIAAFLLSFLLMSPPALAGEIFLGAGFADDTETGNANTQGGRQISYFEPLNDWSLFSFTYLNEGHQPEHKRDGFAAQIWARTPAIADLRFGFGVGPYLFFDTRTNDFCFSDIHQGLTIMSSGTITWYRLAPLLFQIRGDFIHASNSFDGLVGTIAVGFLMGDKETTASGNKFPETRNEIDLYAGKTIMNSDHSHALALSAEYRRKLFSYLDWSIGFLHEGDNRPVGRYGVMSQLWLGKDFFDNRLMLAFGAGPYLAHDRYGNDNSTRDTISGAISMTAAWRITSHLGIRGVFHRIMTNYDWDSDVFLGGLAISF